MQRLSELQNEIILDIFSPMIFFNFDEVKIKFFHTDYTNNTDFYNRFIIIIRINYLFYSSDIID